MRRSLSVLMLWNLPVCKTFSRLHPETASPPHIFKGGAAKNKNPDWENWGLLSFSKSPFPLDRLVYTRSLDDVHEFLGASSVHGLPCVAVDLEGRTDNAAVRDLQNIGHGIVAHARISENRRVG